MSFGDPAPEPRYAMRPGGALVDLAQVEADASRARAEQESLDRKNAARLIERQRELEQAGAGVPGLADILERLSALERIPEALAPITERLDAVERRLDEPPQRRGMFRS